MHYAGEFYAKNFIDDCFDLPAFNGDMHHIMHHVVEPLIEAAPQSFSIEDEDEMNPIKYAMLNATNIKVVKTI